MQQNAGQGGGHADPTAVLPPVPPQPEGAPQSDGPHPWQSQLQAARDRNDQTQVQYLDPSQDPLRRRPQRQQPPQQQQQRRQQQYPRRTGSSLSSSNTNSSSNTSPSNSNSSTSPSNSSTSRSSSASSTRRRSSPSSLLSARPASPGSAAPTR